MVLEEKIVFYSHEDAVDFQKFLRGIDCGSRINVEHEFTGEPFFEGTIPEFLKLIDILRKKDEENGDEDEDLALMKNDIEERRAKLDEFFSQHKAGDKLHNATPSQMLAQVEHLEATNDDDLKKEAQEKFVSSLMVLATLEDNNLLDENDDEYTLKEIATADEMRIMYAYTDIPNATEEDIKECNITSHIRTSSVMHYVVTTDTSIIHVDVDTIREFLDNIDVDDDESGRFIDAVFFKQALISMINNLINSGCSSEKALYEALEAPAFSLGDTEDVISFDLSQEYLSAILSDMKKLGLITGKDGKIKNT